MDWKFWRKNETAAAPSGGKTQRIDKPRDLPQEVGRHLVVEQGLEPDWIWSLKCVRKPRENSKSAFDIRIFSSETVAQHGVKVRDYGSLDNHKDLVIFAGWYDKETQRVQLERLIKEAVQNHLFRSQRVGLCVSNRDCNLHVVPFMDSEPRGLFATRTPKRPNPIGLSVVQLDKLEDGVLHIQAVDILDGTPLLDIEPYVPEFDAQVEIRNGWLEKARKTVSSRKSDDRFK